MQVNSVNTYSPQNKANSVNFGALGLVTCRSKQAWDALQKSARRFKPKNLAIHRCNDNNAGDIIALVATTRGRCGNNDVTFLNNTVFHMGGAEKSVYQLKRIYGKLFRYATPNIKEAKTVLKDKFS